MFPFVFWPYSTRRRLEREARQALALLDAAELELRHAYTYLRGVNQCVTDDESRSRAKRYAMKQINAARAAFRVATQNNLAAIDTVKTYKEGKR